MKHLFDFVDGARQAEHQHVVARLNLSLAVYEHSASVACQSADGHVVRQFQVLYWRFGYFRLLACRDFSHFGVGKCQTFGV